MVLGQASVFGAYYEIMCPVTQNVRSSLLCESFCANTAWSTERASRTRESCAAFSQLFEYMQANPIQIGEDMRLRVNW